MHFCYFVILGKNKQNIFERCKQNVNKFSQVLSFFLVFAIVSELYVLGIFWIFLTLFGTTFLKNNVRSFYLPLYFSCCLADNVKFMGSLVGPKGFYYVGHK